MKATAKHKVVTSGRLTGGGKGQQAKRQVTPDPVPSACPEPAYSLYSTDSENQVTNLHKGLDRCAALLSGILQAEKAASPSPPRAVTGGAAKSRPSTSLGKKTLKKLPKKTVQKNSQSCQRGPGSTTPRTRQFTAPPAHSGVKLHPPQRQPHPLLQSHSSPSLGQTRQHLSPAAPPPRPPSQTSVSPLHTQTPASLPQPSTSVHPLRSVLQSSSHSGRLSASEAPHTHSKPDCVREDEDECVPVRDTNTQSTAADTHTAVRHTLSHIHTCAMKMSNMHVVPGQAEKIPQDTLSRENCSAETEARARTVQYLLGELRALIAGQGSVAEKLLSHLEQTVSSPLMNAGSSNIQTDGVPDPSSLHSQNTELHRQVRILSQQLQEKEKAERQRTMETLSNSEVMTLQEELTTAQSRLQELQEDFTELRKALQDTQSQLRGREAENALLKTGSNILRSVIYCVMIIQHIIQHTDVPVFIIISKFSIAFYYFLVYAWVLMTSCSDTLCMCVQNWKQLKAGWWMLSREKSELGSLAQQRLEDIENLNRILQSQDSSDCATVVDSSVSGSPPKKPPEHRQHPAEPPAERIAQYLRSLSKLDPTHTQRVAAEREGPTLDQKKLTSVHLRDTVLHTDVRQGDKPAETRHQNSHLGQLRRLDEAQQQPEKERGRLLNSTLSQCEVESVWSDWSMRSGSTFDTRDEAAFRDGLAALDASIASLQKTIQLDLRR
ncbi:coiled-coil domain-containing protein 14 [Lates calcarifer]|uniref:Coiled-coil domain-containing protein 14 n=1 Tax=Lates calcarifer TaxID=8187 RepID=A0AAJ8AWP0_LATCA|nr:coiled-coil domain-containing protein 14 [Lates calcarifer]